jgi:hypothetical protein
MEVFIMIMEYLKVFAENWEKTLVLIGLILIVVVWPVMVLIFNIRWAISLKHDNMRRGNK